MTDTGIGLTRAQQESLFRPFNQVRDTARAGEGTGLGLAICKGLVELMGGTIRVDSAEGGGSVFQFTLPLPPAPDAVTPPSVPPRPPLSGLRALLVDDNDASRRALAAHARKWGLFPRLAASGEEALEICRGGAVFDVAILDAQMPGLDGVALAAALRKFPRATPLPVALLTTVDARFSLSELDPASFALVSKPIKPARLLETLKQLASPAAPAPKAAPAPEKPDASLAARHPLRVLLADDNLINQKVATRMLMQLGYRADVVSNGLEAIRALERESYDMVLMDVQMPVLDGLEATRQIRERQAAAAPAPHFDRPLHVVAMTANAMPGDRERCLAAGMDDYLAKPVRPEALQRMMEQFLATAAFRADAPAAAVSVSVVEPSQTEAPVDLPRLLDFSGGDAGALNEIVTLYVTQTTGQLAQIRAALAEGAAARVAAVAHSCAGASGTCGMTTMHPALKKLELAAKHGDLAPLPPLLDAAQAEFARLKEFLKSQTVLSPETINLCAA